MPKLVVDLKNLDDNIKEIERVFNIIKADLNNGALVLASHDLEEELKSLKEFKQNIQEMFSDGFAPALSDQANCNTQLSDDDPNKFFLDPNPKDEYGNTFFPPPFQYDYVEIIYSNYELFEQVRLLGYAGFVVTFPVRYYFSNLKNRKITPTTLKILENLEDFIGRDLGKEIIRIIREAVRKIDEACEKQLSSTDPDRWDVSKAVKDVFGSVERKEWREFAQNYFVPPAVIRPKDDNELTLKDLQKRLSLLEEQKAKGLIRQESIEITENLIQKFKRKVTKKLKQERLEAKKNARKEMPKLPVPIPPDEKCNPNPPKREEEENKLLEQKLEDWKRRHSVACIIKDIKDCYIPPNLDFCQVIFKDPSVNTFLIKLEALKAPGTSQIYDKIINQIEQELGIKETREAAEKIKNLELLVADETELLSYYNGKKENFDNKIINELYPKVEGKKAAILLYNQRISSGELDEQQVITFNQKILYTQQQLDTLEAEIRTLTLERSQITGRLETLKENKQKNEEELETLKQNYESRITELNFSQQQAQLISSGQNLQAVLNAATQESLSGTQLFDTIVQAVDSIMPFENLCALFFQNNLPTISFTIPEGFFESGELKNPFEGLYASWSRIITEFLIDVALGFIDSLMASLCNIIDSALANLAIGENNYEKFTEDLINNGYSAIEPLLKGDYSSIVELGVDKFNTKVELGFKNPLTSRLEKPREEVCDDVPNVTPPIQPIAVDISSKASGVLDFFFGNDRQNPLSQWNISGDKKSFTYEEPPALFDFSQMDQFINNSVNEFLNPESGTGNFSLQALIESFVNKGNGESKTAETPCSTTGPLRETDFNVAATEVSCLIRNSASLLTPSQMLEMLTGNPSEDTKSIVSNLANICAPTIVGRLGNDPNFLMSMMREAGTASGAADFLNSIRDLIDANDFLPTTTSVSCERYDNTRQFIQGLMANTIPDNLAKQILDKIESKRIDNFNHILNTFASANSGKAITRPQDAIQFYLEIVDKLVEAKARGENPETLEELGFQEPEKEQDKDISTALAAQDEYYKSQNPTHNAMLELVNESLMRPLRRTFKNDISNYINTMSGQKEIVKEEELKEEVAEQSVLSLEYLTSIFGESVPALRIPVGVDITLGNPTLTLGAQAELDGLDSYKKDIKDRIRAKEPGQFNFNGVEEEGSSADGLIVELENRYKNSPSLNENDKKQVADRERNKLETLKESINSVLTDVSFEPIQNAIRLPRKRNYFASAFDYPFSFPYAELTEVPTATTNLGSGVDLVDKRQSIFPEIQNKTGINPSDSEDAGNFTYLGEEGEETITGLNLPTQDEISGPPYNYRNPFGENLCFVYNQRNRTINHPYIIEIVMRSFLAIAKYVRRQVDGNVQEKWVIPVNVNPNYISMMIEESARNSYNLTINSKSVNFFDSFDFKELLIANPSDANSPFYSPSTDEILIDTNQYVAKFKKVNLIPLISPLWEDKNTITEQDINNFILNVALLKCYTISNNIRNYYYDIFEKIDEYFEGPGGVRKRLEGKTKAIFQTNSPEDIKIEKIPSWILPFEKSLGQNTIKSTRIILGDVDNENPSLTVTKSTLIPALGDYYYITNGFSEDKYRTPFLNKDDNEKLVSYITTSVNVPGEKFIENSLSIPNNTQIELDSQRFLFLIKGQHGKSSGNPFLQAGNIFNPQNNATPQQENQAQQIIQTQFCGDDIITEVSNPTLFPTEYPPVTIIPPPTIKEVCYNDIVEDPSAGLDLIDNLPDRSNLKNLLESSLPKWELYYEEINNKMELGLNTSGISFSPIGKNFNFYHNTIFQYDSDSIEPLLVQNIEFKYGEFLSKTNAFYKFFNEKTQRDLNKTIKNEPPQEETNSITNPSNLFGRLNNNFGNTNRALESFSQINVDMSALYRRLIEDNFYKFLESFRNNKLLEDYKPEDNSLLEIKEKDKITKKLLELVPLTRDPTEFEKENELDPNIIDFEALKKEFKTLYSLEESDKLTKEQAIGRVASNSKTSKSAKNIFLTTLIRLCVIEHIIKSIFIYDNIKFSKQCLSFDFVIKDIANFVLQEASRYGVGGLMHRQADKLFAIKVSQRKIENSSKEKAAFKEWSEENSYDGKMASPHLHAIVKLEYEKMLNKSSKILNCGSVGKDSSSIIRSLLDEYNIYDAPNVYFYDNPDHFLLLSQQGKREKDFYFEKYVKLGRINSKINILFPGFQFKIREKVLTNEEVENSIFSINDFNALCLSMTREQKEKIFICEDKDSGIFIDEPKIGMRLMLNIYTNNVGAELPLNDFSFNGNILEKTKVYKIKSYCVFADRFKSYSSEISRIQSEIRQKNAHLRSWTSEEENECLSRFGMSCDEAVAERKIEDRRGEEEFLEESRAGGPRFSPEEEQSLQGYEEEIIKINNLIVAEEELPLDLDFLKLDLENMNFNYDRNYLNLLKNAISSNVDTTVMFKYCLVLEEMLQLLLVNSNLVHHDQLGRFLFESTKSYVCDMMNRLKDFGDKRKINSNLANMLEQQKQREDNTGNPLGPALEALKFYYRTPIQILKGQATLVDPNIGIADKIVAGAAMAGSLIGQKIDIPYKVASLALLPAPIFNGVAPPIPPLTAYNMAMPVGPVFLALEHLLKDLPYYQNETPVNENTTDGNSSNPFFCELLPEENDE